MLRTRMPEPFLAVDHLQPGRVAGDLVWRTIGAIVTAHKVDVLRMTQRRAQICGPRKLNPCLQNGPENIQPQRAIGREKPEVSNL